MVGNLFLKLLYHEIRPRSRDKENPESARSVIYAICSARVLTFRDKTESYLTVLQQNNVEALLDVCPASLL